MNILQAQNLLANRLKELYDDEREIKAVVNWALEDITHLSRTERLVYKERHLNQEQENLLNNYINKLLQNIPVQYITGYSFFNGLKFFVDKNVLIPRPETEELVNWVIQTMSEAGKQDCKILDIGTGSGIIPISIKKKCPDTEVSAIDISLEALTIAQKNADYHNINILFNKIDLFNENELVKLNNFDLIISNPPYIRLSEKQEMEKNVLEHEPHLALFVPDDNPLLFYKQIIRFSKEHLKEGGSLFFEINEAFGNEIVTLLNENKFRNIELKKDLQGKDRMVKCMFK